MPKNRKKAKPQKQSLSPSVIVAFVVVVIAVAVTIFAAVQLIGGEESSEQSSESVVSTVSYEEVSYGEMKQECTYAQIEMEDGGIIVLELYPDIAPVTVANFVSLAEEGFYDGLTFHRVISGFVIQSGDPKADSTGGSGKEIIGEFSANGHENPISHERGVISMARSDTSYDSATSQFFICHADCTSLDGKYAAFGRVISGMAVVDAIASVRTNSNNKPYTDVVIKTITVLQVANSGN